MAATVASWFGYKPSVLEAKKLPDEPPKALPAFWYRSPEMYELERRAIFSKKWILVTHKLRFTKPGDFLRFEEAGFSFVLCVDREGNLNGFHNICRHRAFPLVSEDEGNVKILSCKYHGWSYGLNGKLAKAPKFDDVPGFQKEDQSLFPVHVHTDALGFIWVNLDSSPNPVPWEEDFEGVDRQERFQRFDFSQYKFDHTWQMNGDYNWKTLADNYNECYHCTVAHPDVANLADLSYYYTVSTPGHIQHFSRPKPDKVNEDIQNASTYYFPNACMTVSPHFFYLMRCVPTSAGTCSMEYEVYRHTEASDEDFEYIDSFFKRVLDEDKHLCNAAQKNLNAGVFVNGPLHPDLESAPLFFQNTVRTLLRSHRDEERKANREIWPARQHSAGQATAEDVAFCLGPSRQVGTPKSSSRGLHIREKTSESSNTQEMSMARGNPSDETGLQNAHTLPFAMPPKEIVAEGIALYFQYCHKQPLWLFVRDNLSIPERCRSEVIFGILSLALRYSNNPFLEGRTDQMCQQYAEAARSYVMIRIVQGTVDISTLQCFCLIALAEYIANDTRLAWLHIGLATNLAKCAGIDIEQHEGESTPALEERRRVFWSIHLLNQQYAPHSMQLNMLRDIHNPKYMAVNLDSPREMGMKPPQTPQENGTFTSGGGIWVYMVQLSTLWSEVQHYVSHCASGDAMPPWSVDSGYCIIGAHLMDIETKFPTSHRYDSVRFQERSPEELNRDREYWSPWLYLQFTYHAVHSVLNHPFLYSWRPQQSAQLAVPNTFWKTSSELALIHTTWTVRLIDMIAEKEYQLSDPFLGHAVAIAATILMYYCRAADPTVRESAQRKLETCTSFLSGLATKWPRVQAIHQKIQGLIQSAFAVSPHSGDHRSPRRTLSIDTALMWDILCYNSTKTPFASPGDGLFDASLLRSPGQKHPDQTTVETEIFHHSARAVDTSDGGQALPPYSSTVQHRAASETSQPESWSSTNSVSADHGPNQGPLPREPLAWSGSGFPGDVSFMDVTHDPFFQFQDHENPYQGIWEIGNL
ncbi:iron-sulfur cluster-binding protein, rieske family domain protein [Aspergillus thermomutatus]|uniref:Choline monooxygenase, chloroplastic n=1 Tax=Aspergillus thermomutatus TaxID=41047 RepID=A0A397GWV6_ASPTH|nr:uncharacterized protein CDV56_105024 [Aspergillus thermomutatus]RHZ53916.1 hypothetical protein CDV56_105024 [Aspergillus thermomutatus]